MVFVPWRVHHTVSLFAAVLLTCSYSRVTQAAQLAMHAAAVYSVSESLQIDARNYPGVAPTGSDRLRGQFIVFVPLCLHSPTLAVTLLLS